MRLFINTLGNKNKVVNAPIKFGFVTDIHYGDINDYGNAPYDKVPREGATRLQSAIDTFNGLGDLDFVICLGDFIDNGQPSYSTPIIEKPQAIVDIQYLQSVYENFNGNTYNTIGNHDPDRFTKDEYMQYTKMPSNYYYFDKNGIRFIVLDATYWCDDTSCSYEDSNYLDEDPTSYIPQSQLTWLEGTLSSATDKVVVFVHQVANEMGGPEFDIDYFRIDNRVAFRSILEASGKVIACFNGHEHGNFSEVINGIPYYTLEAMTKASISNAYGVVDIAIDRSFTINGYGGQSSYNI